MGALLSMVELVVVGGPSHLRLQLRVLKIVKRGKRVKREGERG